MLVSSVWEVFWQRFRNVVLAWSVASLISSLLLCVCYRLMPQVRRTPGWFLIRATVCDMLVSLAFVILVCAGSRGTFEYHGERYTVIWATLLFVAGCEVGAHSWRLMMYMNLVNTYRNPFRPGRHRWHYHLLSATLGGLMAALCAVQFATCDAADAQSKSDAYILVVVYGLMVAPFAIYVGVGGLLYVTVRVLVARALRDASANGIPASISVLARQRVMRHGLAYLLLYGALLTAGLVTTAVLYKHYKEQPWLWHVIIFLTCGRPVATFVGWLVINGVIRPPRSVWCITKQIWIACASAWDRLTRSRQASHLPGGPLLCGANPATGVLDPEVAAALTDEGQGLAVGASSSSAAGRRSRRDFRGLPITASDAMELRAVRAQGIEGCFKEELRFELLYDVVRDIGELANAEMWGEGHSAGSSRDSHSALRDALCLDRPSLGAARIIRQMHLNRRHEQQRRRAPTNYGASDFRVLRAAFGISPAAYARAFPNDLSESDPTWRRRLKESLSEGASGAFFYRVLSRSPSSESSPFLVKQITRAQKDELMSILPAYKDYVLRRTGRSLIQYLGCHAVSLRWKWAGKVYFVVMRNFMPVKSWLTFDLKGATANRRALAPHRLHQVNPGENPGDGAAYGTLRDWEWMDTAMTVHLADSDKADLFEVISADADFLSAEGFLDYSLLVGVHRVPAELTAKQREKRLGQLQAMGGYIAVDRQKVYFFGIIDVLERYSLLWRVQNVVLTGAYVLSCQGAAAEGISALAPHDYADRFKTFVASEVLKIAPVVPPAMGAATPGTLHSLARWAQLWRRQRRGLVRELIEGESADQRCRIAELEQQLAATRARACSDPIPEGRRCDSEELEEKVAWARARACTEPGQEEAVR